MLAIAVPLDDARFADMSDEDIVLAAQEGDREAADYLLRKYHHLAEIKSSAYHIPGGERQDLVQEGLIGLMKAITNFRPERELRFERFADICVERQIITAVKTATRVKHRLLSYAVSLERPLDGDDPDGTCLVDVLPAKNAAEPEQVLVERERTEALLWLLREILSDLELKILRGHMAKYSYKEMAAYFQCSPKTIDNAMQRVTRKLSRALRQGLPEHIPTDPKALINRTATLHESQGEKRKLRGITHLQKVLLKNLQTSKAS